MYFKSLLLLCASVSTVVAGKTSLRKRNLLETFECILTEVATETPDHDTKYEHMCIGKGSDGDFDMIYHIDDNNNAIDGAMEGLDIMHNSARYKVTMTNIVKETAPVITTTPETEVEIDDLGQEVARRHLKVEGTREMVIFRVTAPDTTPSKTAADIADAFFGANGSENSLSARYAACSFNKLKFIPGTGNDFTNGVAEIAIDINIAGAENFAIQDAVTRAIIAKYGSSLRSTYDHVVYAFPHGTTFGGSGSTRWLSYAYMNSYLSVYNGDNIVHISTQVHETGHNLGLMHSNHGTQHYGDQSGTMGFVPTKEDFSHHTCFNAVKSWALGWYDDHSIDVANNTVAQGWKGNLDSFVDYEEASDGDYVLIKVETKYLIYNKKKGINDETMEFANTVSISDAPTLRDYSDAVGALGSAGQTYEFDGTTIELCSMQNVAGVDQATIGIYKSNKTSSCTDGVASDTPAGPVDPVETDYIDIDSSSTSYDFECVLVEIATEFENHDTDYEHGCIAQGLDGDWDMRYHIDDNNGKILKEISEQGLDMFHHSGRYKVTMKDVELDNNENVVSTTTNTEIMIDDLGEEALSSRRLSQKIGTRSMVVIRVTTSLDNKASSKSANKIADSFFGVAGDQTSLKARFDACSMGKLKYEPGTGHDFVDGVSEITVAATSSGNTIQSLEKVITNAVIAKFGSSLRNTYDHVVYAVPRGTTFGVGGSDRWLAYAYMSSYLSVYNDDNIVFISNQIHETGHNLGLMHSNHGSVNYGDQSGTMGYGYGKESFPMMCFNAAKSWQLGWYDEKSQEVKPEDGAFSGRIVAFVDYNQANDNVIYKVGTKYIIYNRAKGPNSQTMEFANDVTITDMPFEGDYSNAVASLSSNGQTYDFDHAGGKAVIEFCNKNNNGGVDGVKISIYMQSDGSACNGDPPPKAPTVSPTPKPQATAKPNPSPTPRPVVTSAPVPAPTRPPTPIPPTDSPVTGSPTAKPTLRTCVEGMMDVVITIHTDNKPNETSWYFKRRRGQTYGSGSGFTEALQTYTYQYCLPARDTFEFHLLDSGGDGIQSDEFGHGYYTILVNGEVYSSGGYFKSEETDYVSGKCDKEHQKRMQFILTTGFHPEDVTWSLTSDPVEVVSHIGGPWPNYEGQSINYFAHACLDESVCFTVGVHSAKGVGLDRGNFEVNWDDSNVGFSTFRSGDSESFSFGNCGPTDDERKRKLDLTQKVEVFEDFGL